MIKNFLIGIILSIFSISLIAQTIAPEPFGPVPNENQMRWQEMEYYSFVHFSLNTYTDQSWGYGNEDVNLFNPDSADCRQWARICKESGMKGVIITAKHHCGFCLWPSAYTEYSVKNAPWKNGQGDMVREMADACEEYGLKLGIYLSPWDRNHADYGKPEYITYFRNQLTELLTNYGEIFEVWFDGANGGSGYYGGANETRTIDRTTYYDWKNTYALIRQLQPNIVIWNDGGDRGDLRWVGTEDGYVGETNWSLLNATGEVNWGMLHYGLESGNSWVPAEVNTSIRPEWFYHPSEDTKVKTVSHLVETYYNSIGRNGSFLLNFPIMPNGLIHSTDKKNALELAQAVKESFAVNLAEKKTVEASNVRGNALEFGAAMTIDSTKDTYWTTDDNVTTASLTIDLGDTIIFNRFMAQEYIRLGQRVKAFTVEAFVDGVWKEITRGTTIGYKRILRFPSVNATKVRFNITGSKSCPVISNIGIYNAPLFLNAPTIIRNQAGIVTLTTNDIGPIFYYTLDGSEPTTESKMYTAPFIADGKVEVKAIAYDPASGKSGTVGHEKFDISKKKWKIVGTTDANATKILDGDPATAWHLRTGKKLPIDLVIDLGATYYLCGFKYLPDQSKWSSDVITNYQFYVSVDNVTWKLVNQGEFSNIQNNPVWQIKSFTPVNARYIKLIAVKTTWGDDVAGYSEVEVITDTYTGILEEGVTLDSEKDTIKISETKQLVATVIPSDASVKTVSWISSNPKVAKVSESGLVTAVSAGLANITATTANVGLKATCKITVLADTLTSVTQAKKLDDVAIFPNPLNGKQLTVDLGGLKGTTTIQFIEINGQTVLEQTVFDKQCTQLNVNLKPGIYMVRFSNNQNTLLKKLVIN